MPKYKFDKTITINIFICCKKILKKNIFSALALIIFFLFSIRLKKVINRNASLIFKMFLQQINLMSQKPISTINIFVICWRNTLVTPGLLQKNVKKSVTVRVNFRFSSVVSPIFRKFDKNCKIYQTGCNSPGVTTVC